jgi:hypothetical protein
MLTIDMWQQAMKPSEAEAAISCMDDVAIYQQWLAEVEDDKCPFCGQAVVVRLATVCGNPECIFKTVTYSVLMAAGEETD